MSVREEVIALISKRTGIASIELAPNKTFYELGIEGDDAFGLIGELCEKYNIALEGVDLNRYIGPEAGFGMISHLFQFATGKISDSRKWLTVGNLIETAEHHRWFDNAV